jgi:hypothetical protein
MTMADEVKFKLHVDEFQRAADRLAHYSKRDGETFMKEQIRGFIRHLLDFTPPSRGSTRGVKAKKLGEQAIVGDIRAVFRGVSDSKRADVDSMAQMRSVLKSRRRSGTMRVDPSAELDPSAMRIALEGDDLDAAGVLKRRIVSWVRSLAAVVADASISVRTARSTLRPSSM